MSTPFKDAILQSLADNGLSDGNDDTPHSWRCGHPDRYGPCDCATEVARDILAALAPLIRAREAAAWDEGFSRGFYDVLAGGDRDASESAATNPYDRQEADDD